MNRFIILFFILCFVSTTKAQSNCDQNIKQAEELYNSGDYENSIIILEKSIKECNFSDKKKEEALEFLAKSHLEQDNINQAEITVQSLLENNPQYELKETDSHEDFDLLVKKFDVHPLFSLGISNAGMQPKLKIFKTYSILGNIDYNTPYKTTKTILLYYAWAEYEFKKNLAVSLDIIPFSLHYDRSFSKKTDWAMIYTENISFVEVPLYLKKHFQVSKNILPYASVGMGYLRMLKADATSYIAYTNEDVFTGEKSDYSATGNTEVLKMRNKNNYEWLAGVGIGFKFKNFGLFFDARYCGGLNSLTNSANRFKNDVLTNDYFYIDNSIKLNKVEFGISLSYTLKNVIKKVR